jgi:transposase InsO family protein
MIFKQYLYTISHNEIVQVRLNIIKFFDEYGARATKKAFGFCRSTVFLWKKRYKDSKEDARSLIPDSKRPKRTRIMVVDGRILSFLRNLRENNYRLGKEKIKPLLDIYCKELGIPAISESKVGKIIKQNKYFFQPKYCLKHRRRKKDRLRLPKEYRSLKSGECIQIDTITRFDLGTKRYILTAIDLFSRFTFAFAYTTLNSRVALDFFQKLEIVSPFEILTVKTDNGLEFLGEFDEYLTTKQIKHFFSYPRTPKSNAYIERFNRSIQEEFVDNNLEYFFETDKFNERMMEYLVYYNQVRPHKSLKNQTPLGYLVSQGILSNMSVTSTAT